MSFSFHLPEEDPFANANMTKRMTEWTGKIATITATSRRIRSWQIYGPLSGSRRHYFLVRIQRSASGN
jgi:hypothetical protein